jgi:hypothetical protein
MKGIYRLGLIFGLALALTALGNSSAQAAFVLRLTSGAQVVTITDDGAGDITNGTPGQITFAGSVGNFMINVTTGLGHPVQPNTPFLAHLHLNNVSVSSNLGGTLTIELSQTDLTLAPVPGEVQLIIVFVGVVFC